MSCHEFVIRQIWVAYAILYKMLHDYLQLHRETMSRTGDLQTIFE